MGKGYGGVWAFHSRLRKCLAKDSQVRVTDFDLTSSPGDLIFHETTGGKIIRWRIETTPKNNLIWISFNNNNNTVLKNALYISLNAFT